MRLRDVRARVYIVGGAAISLQFDARRATRDIDAVVLVGHGPLMDEVRAIARQRGLPSTWLNEQAAMYVSTRSDPAPATVFDHPYLTVASASAEHPLAMKLAAARGSDIADIRFLMGRCEIGTTGGAEELYGRVFVGERLSDRARLLVEDLLHDG